MRIVSVVGTRPQLITAAALAPVLMALVRLADPREAPALAAERARTLALAPAGAAEAISGILRGRPG